MNRLGQTVVLCLLGTYVGRIALTNEYATYVKSWMRWPLLVSGLLLIVVALTNLVLASRRTEDPERSPQPDHEHAAPRTAWLLAMPFFVIVLIAPQPLGAYVAERKANRLPVAEQTRGFPEVPASAGPVPMQVTEFVARALYDPGRSLEGREVELSGFVSRSDDGTAWDLTRISVQCCAADATAYRIRVLDAPPPPQESWVRVVGTWVPAPTAAGKASPPAPKLRAITLTPIETPKQQYE